MLTGLNFSTIALLMVVAVLLDLWWGEVRRWHPLVGFGNWAIALERRLNLSGMRYARGVLAWMLAVLPLTALPALLIWALAAPPAQAAAHAMMLYFCLGMRSLRDHNLPIADALAHQDLPNARRLTSYIVSRDTTSASEVELTRASAESLLENGNDAVFSTLFWFIIAGGPGAVLFRMANTLDAMWGYRTPRFLQFGWAAARIDDVLNYIPARLTALSYVLLAPGLQGKRRAWRCWRAQAPAWDSPNAGPVMSSGAGALGVQLGGAAIYHGEIEHRPTLGDGPPAVGADISRAWQLVARTTALWLAVACAIAALMELSHA
ncbi:MULTISPECIES: adenosylcobinamide-phosphate synthase CbiB [unclassified Duganella]|uniref:adenosylcobinamide-phosphate synthase CbiB n=1 Tax=unclassified Duganella TaxID=2636909 RepID=UPI000889EDDF|nr:MULTISPECIES: adenosylcobinamide-phosphate synthase CbiB [unclassified Duganella]SDH64989.1 adenosylcobinamide-phosphate synthase [Duganella sp. OV458]SDK74980.1 adenosylcobinamide-phosphate synthase [Duganella sp. OV510]